MYSSNIIPAIEQALANKTSKALTKLDGKKKNKLYGLPKLEDANWAGTKKSNLCTLILTEGDSAKALAVAGLSSVGRNMFGVFPLKGKLINASKKKAQVLLNTEVQNLVKILGLQIGKSYRTIDDLRYGHVMIMADQDSDGSHIKGLLIYLLETMWPSLLSLEGFLQQFITPIVRVIYTDRHTPPSKDFFDLPSFEMWTASQVDNTAQTTGGSRPYTVKYYKGLGTSTSKDARNYFSNLPTHRLLFAPIREGDRKYLQMAFGKESAPRKKWIAEETRPSPPSDISPKSSVSISQFVTHELVHYARDSVKRAIPSLWDGLKPGQRKILYTMFNISDKERKVSQLMGIVSEKTHYHHGEASLGQTIVRMGQAFCGKNNINLLQPNGQFGTRMSGGEDSADPRYIFTKLDPLAKYIFRKEDNVILSRVLEDGLRGECVNFLSNNSLTPCERCAGHSYGVALLNTPALAPCHHQRHPRNARRE